MEKERFDEGMAYAEKNYREADSHLYLDKKLFLDKFDLNGKTILDFGCGMGGMSLWIAEHWRCSVTALDIDPFHIEIAESMKKKYKHENVVFSEQNILEKPLEKKFDLITLFDVAEHIEIGMLQKIMQVIKQHLKPDGKVFVSYPPWDGPWGSHLDKIMKFPWPQFLPKNYLFRLMEQRNHKTVGRNDVMTDYLELNHLRPRKLREIMEGTGFKQEMRISHTKFNKLKILENVNINFFPFNYIVSKELVLFERKD